MKNSLAALLLMALFALGCGWGKSTAVAPCKALPSMSDAQFAETAFKSLTGGDASAECLIDWESFRVADVDVGSQYRAMPGDTAKGAFRSAFISKFASSFKETGASASDVSGWRDESRAGDTTTVVGKVRNTKTIRLTITHKDGRQGLASIQVD